MSPIEFYDDVALQFPALWPQRPEWEWVNVHDGKAPLPEAISALLKRRIGTQEVVVLVRSDPGVAFSLPLEEAVGYVAAHVLKHEVQVSNPLFTSFVSVSRTGVATGDA